MKNLKKILALLLCVAMVFVMAACTKTNNSSNNDNDDEEVEEKEEKKQKDDKEEEEDNDELTDEMLEGEWTTEISINEFYEATQGTDLVETLDSELVDFGLEASDVGVEIEDDYTLTFILEFDGKGEATLSGEAADFVDFMDEYYNTLADMLVEPETFAELMGATVDDISAVAAEEDMTAEEWLEEQVSPFRTLGEEFEELLEEISSDYEIDKFTVDACGYEFEYDNDELCGEMDGLEVVFEK